MSHINAKRYDIFQILSKSITDAPEYILELAKEIDMSNIIAIHITEISAICISPILIKEYESGVIELLLQDLINKYSNDILVVSLCDHLPNKRPEKFNKKEKRIEELFLDMYNIFLDNKFSDMSSWMESIGNRDIVLLYTGNKFGKRLHTGLLISRATT